MLEVLPIGPEAIHRTAERMIADHGRLALDMADRRAGRFRSEGLEPLAHLWDLIGAVVEDLQDTMGAGKPHAEFCRELGFPID
jgi:hypothetical protein